MAGPRRRKAIIGQRRRVEDEGEEEGGPDALDLEDDSLTDGSVTDEGERADDSDTSNIDEASPTSPKGATRKSGNGAAKGSTGKKGGADVKLQTKPISETDIMLNGMGAADEVAMPVREMNFDDVAVEPSSHNGRAPSVGGPIVVSSGSVSRAQTGNETVHERRRREHDEYRRRRDEDPAFVPNRGAFFMHDHRHSGPAANGFRPFNALRGGRGQLNGGGRGGFAHFAPAHQTYIPADTTASGRWKHDMHDAVAANPTPPPPPHHHHRSIRRPMNDEGPPNGDGFIPTCPTNPTPINRTLSMERHLGNVHVRVNFPPFDQPVVFTGIAIKQYTKLPDHRPPLRRDKPVRISLPGNPPRYIFPASDRSFIFIPRALRPNQQKARGGRARSGLGSIGGYSRRTSIFGGSFYGGSTYSPSIAMSRRSSIAPDMMGGRDFIISPTGSAFSRPPLPVDAMRPVVRLPPHPRPPEQYFSVSTPVEGTFAPVTQPGTPQESTLNDVPPPQMHPLPQKPVFQEQRSVPAPLTVHQPRPQKAVSVENIESPTMMMHQQPAMAQPFHQQMPVHMGSGYPPEHNRQNSFVSQHSTGTPLSQIPERAIHAAPFQPTVAPYAQAAHFFTPQPYQVMPPQPGYYYPPQFQGAMGPSAGPPPFVSPTPQGQAAGYAQQGGSADPSGQHHASAQTTAASNLVAQEVNGMVYYYDASQLAPAVSAFPPPGHHPYGQAQVPPPTQNYGPPVGVPVGMPGPSDAAAAAAAYYYPPAAPGVVYYSQ